MKGLKIASKLIGPLNFISYFKANFWTYKKQTKAINQFKSSSLLYRKDTKKRWSQLIIFKLDHG